MIFSLDVVKARKGDCLLLHWGDKAAPSLALIDGGPRQVYGPHLKPRLLAIKQARGLGAQPLPVDLLMVSHVDDDHIQGILDLTGELTAAGVQAPLLQVASFWHNSFDDAIGNDAGELAAAVPAGFGAASLSSRLVLASIEQGHRLRNDAEKLLWPRNPEFDGKLVRAAKQPLDMGNGLSFTVAGPLPAELAALQKEHAKWLEGRKKKKKTGEAALAAYVDKSVANLSSIVVLAQCGGKRALLTGDARGDKVLKGLETAGALKKGGKLHVDLLKMPHHGSARNLDDDFFERISADHYVFSGNGEHGNPEREAFEMLLKARGKQPFHIHLTYPIKEIDVARKADWEKEQAKEKKKKAKKKPRPDWSAAKHGLAALFDRKLAPGQKLHIVGDGAPHVIDLLEPLG